MVVLPAQAPRLAAAPTGRTGRSGGGSGRSWRIRSMCRARWWTRGRAAWDGGPVAGEVVHRAGEDAVRAPAGDPAGL